MSRTAQPTNAVLLRRNPLVLREQALRASARSKVSLNRSVVLKVTAKDFTGPYSAENKYKCADAFSCQSLKSEWQNRESKMKSFSGFVSFSLQEVSPQVYAAVQVWNSKEEYEAWMGSDFKRKSHFSGSIYQYTTKDKYSVPEEFMPILTAADN
eukprot:CAMPEP_0198199046 /NCGR_PEP_ID=MMETSP1445-20131203/2380_1 /TAXON_ID=36898 /ORGANISM="Pyramimonas sp., Strain CCMP2087" /LENGTH=153 /DNA_ID=CAMNT_0043868757 /DNA_START=71 /DNA_END=532 /DNA_ORIENTATION=-